MKPNAKLKCNTLPCKLILNKLLCAIIDKSGSSTLSAMIDCLGPWDLLRIELHRGLFGQCHVYYYSRTLYESLSIYLRILSGCFTFHHVS